MDTFIQSLAQEGGEIALRAFRKGVSVRHCKLDNPNNVVTDTDVEVEEHIIGRIRKEYPTHGIIAEESGSIDTDVDDVWIIDPIDGTLNFATGVPLFAIMIAHMHKGEVDLAAINLPVTNELFFAKRGDGAYCNGERLTCMPKNTLKRSRGCLSSPASAKGLDIVRRLNASLPGAPVHINAYGSMGVHACYVAAGRRDWMVSLAPSFHDLAATSFLAEMAGCTVTDIRGEPVHPGSRGMVVSHPECHISLLRVVQEVLEDRGE